MTTKEKAARRKLILLELATDLDNVSKACKLLGYSRQKFYEIRRNFQTHGAASRAAETNQLFLTFPAFFRFLNAI